MDNAAILEEVASQVRVCQACDLHFSRKNAVPGEGAANSEIMFIGEAPGFHENERGRPFVGQAGKFLDELLTAAGYTREQVFIANVVKCRPPENRDPLPDELAACSRFLNRQIEAIQPRVIVTLGRVSMGKFLPNARISEVHGKTFRVGDFVVVPMYHPAAALHQPSLKPVLIADFQALPAAIESARPATQQASQSTQPGKDKPETTEDKPEQLSLF